MRKITLLTCLIGLVLASVGNAVLVNRYSFNGNCNDSVGSNNGTLVNITGNSAYSGGMLVLGNTGVERTSGNIGNPNPGTDPWPLGDYVDLPNGTLYNAFTSGDANSFTIEMWVRIDAEQETEISLFDFGHSFEKIPNTAPGEVAGNQAYPYDANLVYGTDELFAEPGGKRTYFSPFAPGTGAQDNLRWRWRNETNYQNPGIFPETQLIPIPTTGTVHIVCSYKLNTGGSEFPEQWQLSATLYINGQLAGTRTDGASACDFSLWPTAGGASNGVDLNCWLGRSQQRYAKYLQGAYDEVRIYNHALTGSEVAYNYNVGPNYYCVNKLEGDLDGDCFVNMDDFKIMYANWLNQSPRKAVKDALIHRWRLDGDLEDSVGTADGTLVSEKITQYEMADQYVALRHTWDEKYNNLLLGEPTKGTCIQLPNGLLAGEPNVTIEMFVTENDHRWDAQHFNFGANDQYWQKVGSTFYKREDIILGNSSQDSGCNPFFKFQSYIENSPQESMQCWWHQSLGHWGQNIYVRPPLSWYRDPNGYNVNVKQVAMTVENNVPGIWNWTTGKPTQPGDDPSNSFGPGDRITFYSNGAVAMGGEYATPKPAIKIVPQHEGPNFQDAWQWNDDGDGKLEAGEAQGWKETANYIGRNGFTSSGPDARYYDFRIYNRALTAAEIAADYAAGSEAEICNVAGDINADCVVDLTDFAVLSKEWFLNAITY